MDVRIVAATNIDLRAAVAAGKFREDLFYRLNVFPIWIPPLRERRDDVALLAALFVERHHRSGQPDGFTADALAALLAYDWPGNVRQLENVVHRALAVSDGPKIGLGALTEELTALAQRSSAALKFDGMTYREMLDATRDRATRDYLIGLMRELGGNVTQAAERAGIERESMHRLLKKHGVRSEDFKSKA
jgi:two-component system response regulator HydG